MHERIQYDRKYRTNRKVRKQIMKTKIKARNLIRASFCILTIMIVVLASMSFYVKKSDNMDFVRIQELMDPLHNTKITLWEYLFTDTGKELNQTLNYTYTFNFLLYLTGKYCNNQYALPWISAIIDYVVILYIYYDWKKSQRWTITETIVSFFICMAFLPFVHVLSGIRAAMAACFIALAIYEYIYKNKSVFTFLVFAFLSVTVHPFTIYAIPVAMLIKVSPSMKTFIIVLTGTLALVYLVPIIGRMGIPFISGLATKFATYTNSNQYTSYRSFFYCAILFAMLLILYYVLFMKVKKADDRRTESKKDKIYKFLMCYSAVLLGSFGSYEIVCRLAYVLGAFSPILAEMFFSLRKKDKGRYILSKTICILVFVLCAYAFMKHIRYYGGFFRLGNIAISTNPSLQK